MKKTIALSLALFIIMTLCGCQRTEIPSIIGSSTNPAPIGSINAEKESSENTVPDIVSDPNPSETNGGERPTLPPEELDEEYIYDPHDWEYNRLYNYNVTDTSYDKRYYGDFEWVNSSKTLWTGAEGVQPTETYDPDAAVAYGREHWDDGEGLCAPFISRCLLAGGITEYTESSTSITLQLLNSHLGFGQFLQYDKSDHTIPLPSYARPGDVVQIYCSYEGVMIHSLLMVAPSRRGRLKAVCHNYRNNGEYEFRIDDLNDPCYDCESETVEVFFYHFYRDDDTGLPQEVVDDPNIILWEEKGYCIQDEEFDRASALEYAMKYHEDGVGSIGAEHTSAILRNGGITVSYPNQSALFFQLLKTHLGSAYSLSVNINRTVYLPEFASAGDICFGYCPEDGIMFTSFIIAGTDEYGRMVAHSYDKVNDGKSAFKVESVCPGCDCKISEVVLYHFD